MLHIYPGISRAHLDVPQMEMLQLLESRECCSEQRGCLSKELLPVKCVCCRAPVPCSMAGRLAQSHDSSGRLCFLVR